MINKNSQLFILFLLVYQFLFENSFAMALQHSCVRHDNRQQRRHSTAVWKIKKLDQIIPWLIVVFFFCLSLLFLLIQRDRVDDWFILFLWLQSPYIVLPLHRAILNRPETCCQHHHKSSLLSLCLCLSFASRSIIIIYNRERDWHWWKKKDIPGIDIIRLSVEQTNEQL